MFFRKTFFLFLLFGILIAISTELCAAEPDKFDSLYINTLNMTDEETKAVYGLQDSTETTPTLQERFEDDIRYEKRQYNHKQQVIVGGVVMLCIALVMVMMNNYNPMR